MFPVKVETRILLNCPHCRFSSRYDTGFLEDAIHDHKEISCVACGGPFSISVVAVERRLKTGMPQTAEWLCDNCKEYHPNEQRACPKLIRVRRR